MGLLKHAVEHAVEHVAEVAADGVIHAAGVAVLATVAAPFAAVEAVSEVIKSKRSEEKLLDKSKAENLMVVNQVSKVFSKSYFEVLIEGEQWEFTIKAQTKEKQYLILNLENMCLGSVMRSKWKRHKYVYEMYAGNEYVGEVIPRLQEKNTYDIEQLGWVITSNMFHNKYTVTNEKKKKIIEITYTSEDNNNYIIEYKDENSGLYAMLLLIVVDCIRNYDL